MKRLFLSKDKKILGVCGGIAEYFDVDPTLVRLAWAIITILTAVAPGVIAYAIVAIIVPHTP